MRYIDSDCHEVREELLGLVEVVGNKGAQALCTKIFNVLESKGLNIENMRFNRMDATNTISGQISGLQWQFRHLVPHTKYMNCRNHKLALVFVHLLDKYETLKAVDTTLVSVWKAMKYSSVKSAVYGEAQMLHGLSKLKLLKAAPTRWLSHGEATKRLISRFHPLVDALDSLINKDHKPETIGIRDELLKPDNVLMLLLLADVLVPINQFSMFLQKKNLIYVEIGCKFNQLLQSIEKVVNDDGSLFKEHAMEFLKTSRDCLELARRT